jgi:hypothetical protein
MYTDNNLPGNPTSAPTPADIMQGEDAVALLVEMVNRVDSDKLLAGWLDNHIIPRARAILGGEPDLNPEPLTDEQRHQSIAEATQPPAEPSADQYAYVLDVAVKAVEKALQDWPVPSGDITTVDRCDTSELGGPSEADRLRECLGEVTEALASEHGCRPWNREPNCGICDAIATARALLDGGGK